MLTKAGIYLLETILVVIAVIDIVYIPRQFWDVLIYTVVMPMALLAGISLVYHLWPKPFRCSDRMYKILHTQGIPQQAKVISANRKVDHLTVCFSYEGPEGKIYRVTNKIYDRHSSDKRVYNEGDSVSIRYNAKRPSQAMMDYAMRCWAVEGYF